MNELAANISLHTSTSLAEALKLPVSFADNVFKTSAFNLVTKNKEIELKVQAEIGERLNNVVKAIGILIKKKGS